jgi:hypothetical protein
MFEWVLIGLELALLYFGFWFVFIRTPRVHRINASMWGTYENGSRQESNWDQAKFAAWRSN